MKNRMLYGLLLSVVLGCQQKPEKTAMQLEVETAHEASETTTKLPKIFPVENMFRLIEGANPIIFKEDTKMYEEPSVDSKAIFYLAFGDPVVINGVGDELEEKKKQSDVVKWYQVKVKGVCGYVSSKAVVLKFYQAEGVNFSYALSMEENPVLYRYNNLSNKILDSLKLQIYRYDLLKRLSRCALDKVNQLFIFSYSDDFCGGGAGKAFIAIAEGKLTEIATTEITYDDEPGAEGSSSKFYLPVKFDNGNVLLIPDGNLDNPELLKQSLAVR